MENYQTGKMLTNEMRHNLFAGIAVFNAGIGCLYKAFEPLTDSILLTYDKTPQFIKRFVTEKQFSRYGRSSMHH